MLLCKILFSNTNLDVRRLFPLDSSNASPVIEFDLPDSAQISEQVFDTIAGLYVPKFQSSITATDDLLVVVLEAGDSPSVSRERALAMAVLWIPYSERGVCSCRDQAAVV